MPRRGWRGRSALRQGQLVGGERVIALTLPTPWWRAVCPPRLLAGEDLAHQRRRGHHEHDHGLDHRREVDRDACDRLHIAPAGDEGGEQERAEDDPAGRFRPKSATVMALNPVSPPYPVERKKSVPESVAIPAIPTSAPDIVSTRT